MAAGRAGTGPAFGPSTGTAVVRDVPLSVRGVTRIVHAQRRRGYTTRAATRDARCVGGWCSRRRSTARASGIMAQTGHRSRRLVRRYMTESGRLGETALADDERPLHAAVAVAGSVQKNV